MTQNIPMVVIRAGSPHIEESTALMFRLAPSSAPIMFLDRHEILEQHAAKHCIKASQRKDLGQGRIHSGDLVTTLADMIQNRATTRKTDCVFLTGMPENENESSSLIRRFGNVRLVAASHPKIEKSSDSALVQTVLRFRKKRAHLLHSTPASSGADLIQFIIENIPLSFHARQALRDLSSRPNPLVVDRRQPSWGNGFQPDPTMNALATA